jgi:Fe-S cluster assembly iron-binding protein IscA
LIEITLAAASQLRGLVRTAGVVGLPGVRLLLRGGAAELVIEDRRGADDVVNEARGIRFYLDAGAVSELSGRTLDLEGTSFVLLPHVQAPTA